LSCLVIAGLKTKCLFMAPSVGDKIDSKGLHSTIEKVIDLQKASQQ